jgi:endonuclease/exonuclease/phosphatase family metal-dependent hydrolase
MKNHLWPSLVAAFCWFLAFPAVAVVEDGGNFTMLTHNISGASPGNDGHNSAAIPAIYYVRDSSADAAALQEVCSSQVAYIQIQLSDYRVYFDVAKPRHDGCQGADKRHGNVVVVNKKHAEVGDKASFVFKYYDSVREGVPDGRMLCAKAKKGKKKFLACSVHVPFDITDAQRSAAITKLSDHLFERSSDDWKVAVGGDFNAKPEEVALDPMYSAFREADQFFNCGARPICRGGRDTHESDSGTGKIDYVWFSMNFDGGIVFSTALSGWLETSKHQVLWGTTPMP